MTDMSDEPTEIARKYSAYLYATIQRIAFAAEGMADEERAMSTLDALAYAMAATLVTWGGGDAAKTEALAKAFAATLVDLVSEDDED